MQLITSIGRFALYGSALVAGGLLLQESTVSVLVGLFLVVFGTELIHRQLVKTALWLRISRHTTETALMELTRVVAFLLVGSASSCAVSHTLS